jgi:general secretion pathway protein D
MRRGARQYQLAAELNPTSSAIDERCAQKATLRAKVLVAHGEGPGSKRSSTVRAICPARWTCRRTSRCQPSLVFRSAGSRDVFLSIAKFADISIGFDSAYRDTPITIDLRNASLDSALNSVADASQAFFKVTAPRTVLVIPDTPAKRRDEEEVVRTFFLSNADLKETMDLLRMVLDASAFRQRRRPTP